VAISYVSGASAAANTVAMPSHAAGDLIICWAFRDGSTTQPTVPSGIGWINPSLGAAGTTCSNAWAYKYAASGSETTGTWTNATGVVVVVYRGAVLDMSGGSTWTSGSGSSNSITHPTTNAPKYDSQMWSVRFCGHRTATNLTTNTPAGYTARAGVATECRAMDTNGVFTSATGTQAQSVSASSGWIAQQMQLISPDANPVSTDSDNFNTGSVPDSTKWNTTTASGGTATLASSQLSLSVTATSGSTARVLSKKSRTLTGSSVKFQLGTVSGFATTPTNAFGFIGGGFGYGWFVETPTIVWPAHTYWSFGAAASAPIDGVLTGVTHTAGNWYRVRESGGSVYFDYSSDGTNWTNYASEVLGTSASLAGFGYAVSGYHYGAAAAVVAINSPFTSYVGGVNVDNLNYTLSTAWTADASLNAYATPYATGVDPPDIASLSDRFLTKDTTKWAWSTNATVTSGRAVLPLPASSAVVENIYNNAVGADNYFQFKSGNELTFQLVQPTTADPQVWTVIQLEPMDGGGATRMYYNNGSWIADHYNAAWGYVGGSSVAFSAGAWGKIRNNAGTVEWYTSPDGVNWTMFTSLALTRLYGYVRVNIWGQNNGLIASPGTAIWDNINVLPLTAGSSLTVTASAPGDVSVGRSASAALSVVAAPPGVGRYDAKAQAALFINGMFPAAILKTLNAASSLALTASPSSSGTEFGTAAAQLSATASPSAAAVKGTSAAAVSTITATTTVNPSRGQTIGGSLGATATPAPAGGFGSRQVQANLVGYAFPTAQGLRIHNAAASLAITSTGTAVGFENDVAAAALAVTAARTAAAARGQAIVASLALETLSMAAMSVSLGFGASLAVSAQMWATADEPREIIEVEADDRSADAGDGDFQVAVAASPRRAEAGADVRAVEVAAEVRAASVAADGRASSTSADERLALVPAVDSSANA
jgi:hypothetical protein